MSEVVFRFGIFASVLGVFMTLEAIFPARARTEKRVRRWTINFALGAASVLVRRVLGPVTVAGAAVYAGAQGFGLFNLVSLNGLLVAAASLVLLDLMMWAQHWAMHHVPILSSLHRLHHRDRDLDASSGLRFHPGEAAVSILWKCTAVMVCGAPVAIALAYEIILSAMAIFTHSNLYLPRAIERAMRCVLVTPMMHRTHHSVIAAERNSNYGTALSVWDRLFGTYTDEPAGALVLGLPDPTQQSHARG
jgi:sterol desaturase/sphingolipid hydroxylase (fatty acid hydroxylase superfamily)